MLIYSAYSQDSDCYGLRLFIYSVCVIKVIRFGIRKGLYGRESILYRCYSVYSCCVCVCSIYSCFVFFCVSLSLDWCCLLRVVCSYGSLLKVSIVGVFSSMGVLFVYVCVFYLYSCYSLYICLCCCLCVSLSLDCLGSWGLCCILFCVSLV